MDTSSDYMRLLARRLLALEASKSQCPSHGSEAVRVCEKLRVVLTRVAGPEGFTSLQRRALAIARAEVPALEKVNVTPDGSLEGLEQLAIGERKPGSGFSGTADAAVTITAHLLGLLATFIGQPLTLRLVNEAWPDVSLDEFPIEDRDS